ncbi:MAG: ACP S-malonyltransferase [Liquorilactobacillus hordei]|uniref:Malonyl CoA-acyl carrier protein transacylase n=2 Tax=Liquorilactobacillus hordei TaxID=468911 RepID=A0A0R1MU26_9LACO|nr:ACP S-malonyltransferase [Liquorilactobacillus hordei]AUJ29366.1 ACP S-malonyltransferase [Liquorilactobacillus hordei]KRL07835.1 malonyl-CoA-[acyl-carrier-protein] transacylase [Liquorilactobacillus hordei DSM 19519]MBZ2405379.1 ACP S-malonyltransferase [Liquorilactobacillus hordei]QYH52087.1 ACP S-malonyltransferase [Liquorilactobacillus hordei DSM 19519]
MRIGFLFSGQGAQYSEMGLDFYQEDELFRSLIDEVSSSIGIDLPTVFKNQDGQLSQTKFVQPAIVAMSLGIYQMLRRDLPDLDVRGMLGLSLGEYSALIASGAFDVADGFNVLKDRAAYMQADADETEGAMLAVMKTEHDVIAEICEQASTNDEVVTFANYNSPSQVVIGGHKKAVNRALDLFREQNIKKVIPLNVSGAFHTPLFQKTSFQMERRLADVTIHKLTVPVYSNTTGKLFSKDTIKQILAQQVILPTHFGECLQEMITTDEIDTVVELGPGKTLCKFTKQIDRQINNFNIENITTYTKFVTANHDD